MRHPEKYEAVIGLEIHAQLLTETKMFCNCRNQYGAEPNSHVCPVCLGLPGALPVPNQKAVEFAIAMGLATHCTIASRSQFARKNYFYPDLPKGYQITQFEQPLCREGWLTIPLPDGEEKVVRIERIHLEEDAGKSIHDPVLAGEGTLLDFNRCGVPLIEIVTYPDLRSPREARIFLERLRTILVYLKICDGNMEEGSLRCDANISLRPVGEERLGVKTELKNMNSFRNVERALQFEIERQTRVLMDGGRVEAATLLWDASQNRARVMRSKEVVEDYRYFPEPDLVPITVSREVVQAVSRSLPELPHQKHARFRRQYHLPEQEIQVLVRERALADYFEAVVSRGAEPAFVSRWVVREVVRVLRDRKISAARFPIPPEELAELLHLVEEGSLSQSAARTVFDAMLDTGEGARELVRQMGLQQMSDQRELEEVVNRVLRLFPLQVQQYRNGKTKLLSFFVGQVMKETQGKANPNIVSRILEKELSRKDVFLHKKT